MLLFWIFLAVLTAPPAAEQRVRFEGAVHAGENYRRDLGSGLVFVLRWAGGTWDIRIEPKDGTDNFIGCVTPPFHGPHPAHLDAWHFVDRDTNDRLPEGKELFPRERRFDFVLNQTDHAQACGELEVVLYAAPKEDPKTGGLIIGTPGYKAPPVGSGSLTIKSLTLANLGRGKTASLQSITFEADIDLTPRYKSLLGPGL